MIYRCILCGHEASRCNHTTAEDWQSAHHGYECVQCGADVDLVANGTTYAINGATPEQVERLAR